MDMFPEGGGDTLDFVGLMFAGGSGLGGMLVCDLGREGVFSRT